MLNSEDEIQERKKIVPDGRDDVEPTDNTTVLTVAERIVLEHEHRQRFLMAFQKS